jgi:regulator of RNase E activity RraA
VLGDDDGVVIIPHEAAIAQLEVALAMVEAEAAWEARLAGGASTVDVFKVPKAELVG